MRKNLLVTTALVAVAFSLPVYAADYQYINETGKIIANGEKFEKLNNTSATEAGALTVNTQGDVKIGNDVIFSKNSSNGSGGAMKALGGFEIGDGIQFEGNSSKKAGGALYIRQSPNSGETDSVASTTAKIGKNAQFINNNTNEGWLGGAIAVEYAPDGLIIDEGATFTDNSAKTDGGAIAVWTSENENISDKKITGVILGKGATFTGNTATNRGGAVYNAAMAEITGATFTTNEAATGGAIYNGDPDKRGNNSGTLFIKDSTFTENEATYGGAIFNEATTNVSSASKFVENTANKSGGAIQNWGKGKLTVGDGTEFIGNISGTHGGAIFNAANATIGDNVLFKDNKAAWGGAAISSGTNANTEGYELTIGNNAKFVNNTLTAEKSYGGAIFLDNDGSKDNVAFTLGENASFEKNQAQNGGAVYVKKGVAAEIGDGATFTDNIATAQGGAIYLESAEAKLTMHSANFAANTANGEANDIHNEGTVSVATGSTLTLDGGISGEGTTAFAAKTTLNVKQGVTQIANKVTSEGTTLNVTLAKGTDSIDLNNIFTNTANTDSLTNITLGHNALYNFIQDDEDASLYAAEQKSSSEIANTLGVSSAATTALLAATSKAESSNANFDKVSDALYDAAQMGDSAAVSEAEKLGADAAPVARAVETSRTNMVFAAVNDELNGAGNAMAEGMSAGDYFRKAKAWIRGLFNYADHDGTSKAQGFDADTYGVAMGIDKELDNHVKAGFGYAYSQTDVNGDVRDTDVDTNTLFVYGQYKPADWYINTALAYSWSDYDEKKSVLGHNADAKYDVDTIALQAMYGFERKLGAYDLNPEFGFRYMHISQDGYTDNLGSKVNSKDSDVLTAVAGTKIAKSYELENGMVLRPELKAAVTYDVISDDNNANVMLANGASYHVNGEKLERLGFEFGAKVATDVSDNWEVAAGYELRLRKDYNDNTLMLNAKYNF